MSSATLTKDGKKVRFVVDTRNSVSNQLTRRFVWLPEGSERSEALMSVFVDQSTFPAEGLRSREEFIEFLKGYDAFAGLSKVSDSPRF